MFEHQKLLCGCGAQVQTQWQIIVLGQEQTVFRSVLHHSWAEVRAPQPGAGVSVALMMLLLTLVSMQTTHSELPGPSTGLGAEGVTGVPGVSGGLGIWILGGEAGEGEGEGEGEEEEEGALGKTSAASFSCTASQAPAE